VYVILTCALLLVATALLYPLTVGLGRVGPLRFAKAFLPAQIVGASTQSSLAALPALVEGASTELDLPEESTGFVLPLCVASFKLNLAVSQPVDLLFLALVFGVPLGLGDIVAFMSGVILVSFGSPGVPRGAGFSTLPFYLMVGVPIEGVVIVEAVKSIPDIFFTVLNVTADMSVATILGKRTPPA
jgi:Na+/H+-dicarboxylate symporter